MTKEALKSAIEFAEYCLEELDLSHMASNQAKRLVQKSKEALAKPEQERCVGCEACIDTACGRDECPKGWPKAAQPEQEPVGQLLEDAFGRGQVMWFNKPKDESMLYTTPPQRNPLTKEQRIQIVKDNTIQGYHGDYFDAWGIIDDVEAAHGIKE